MTSHFQEKWLHDPRFKGWVKKKDAVTALSTYCFNKEIKVGSMGESALTGHAKGKKHIQQCPVEGGGIKSITAAT